MIKKITRTFLFILIALFYSVLTRAQSTSIGGGPFNWSSPATWGGTLPTQDTNVVIPLGSTVNVDITTEQIGNLTVNGTLNINNAAGAVLFVRGNITLGPGASVTNNGKLDLLLPADFIMGANASYTHNPRLLTPAEESIFSESTEIFDPTSTLTINKWASTNLPLFDVTRIGNNNVGNLILGVNGFSSWEQNGLFQNKVKGKLTVNAGIIRMDDGTGSSTSLTLNDVDVIGSGNIIFQEGANRPLNLTTGNFLFNSTTTDTMFIMNGKLGSNAIGNLTWTVNGNVDIRNSFFAIYNVDSLQRNANATINISGNFSLSRAIRFDILKQVNGSCNITVGGDFTIGGPVFPISVRFIDSFNGALTFSANNVYIQGGNGNTFMGGTVAPWVFTHPKGLVNFHVNNDFIISGTSTTYIVNSPAYYHASTSTQFPAKINKTRVTVDHDFIISSNLADFKVANDSSAVTFITGRKFTMTGGYFDAQLNPNSIAIDSVIVGENFLFNSNLASNYFKANSGTGGTVFRVAGNFDLINSGILSGQGVYGNYNGNGNVEFRVSGNFTHENGLFSAIYGNSPSSGNGALNYTIENAYTQNAGFHYGVNNTSSTNAGIPVFSIGSVDFNGGTYEAYKALNILYATNTYNVGGNVDINFANAANTFQINSVSIASSNINTIALNFNVSGSLLIGGTNGTFISSKGFGNETINITGGINISGGNNSFNFLPGNQTNHNIIMSVGGNFTHSGSAVTYLSGDEGDFTGNITGDLLISGGTLNLKGYPAVLKQSELNVDGGFNMSGGNFFFYNNLSRTNNVVEARVTINRNDDFVGNFQQTGGTINMNNNVGSTKWDTLEIKSPLIDIGASGQIISSYPNTSSFNGSIKFSRAGTSIFTRAVGSGHLIQQVKQQIASGTTLDVVSGDFQVCSHSNVNIDHLSILSGATMILRNNNKIFSNCIATNAGIMVGNAARLRIQNSNGLYDGTNNAAITAGCNMDYYLFPFSIIEYMGDDNQKLTGIGVGKAIASKHKYGILEINHNGSPLGQEWVYLSSVSNIVVRQQLILRKGELNLSTSGTFPRDVNAGGNYLLIENPMDTALKYFSTAGSDGYLRAETYDGNSQLRWRMGSSTLLHNIPFKRDYNDPAIGTWMAVSYTGSSTAGVVDTVSFTTFRTNPSNLPYPPTVSHLNNLSGTDNSSKTIKRYWLVRKTGASITGDISLRAATSELVTPAPSTPYYKGQNFLNATMAWNFPIPGTQTWTPGTNTLAMTGVPVQQNNGWWAISTTGNPLPVELLSFNAECLNRDISLTWTTASELNNNYFDLEKSSNGLDFSLLKRITGSGTVNELSHYQYTDRTPEKTKLFYRLKQTDYNAENEELKTISINPCTSQNTGVVSAIQTGATLKIVASVSSTDAYYVTIIDNAGRLISKTSINLSDGVNEFSLNNVISKGLYLININNGMETLSSKVFIP